LVVGRELNLIHGEKVDIAIHRHRLDGADPIRRRPGDALLLAGHEANPALADAGCDSVVHLPGEQTQGQADHPRIVGEHPFDGAVRLPRVRRPEDGGDGRAVRHGGQAGRSGSLPSVRCVVRRDVPRDGDTPG